MNLVGQVWEVRADAESPYRNTLLIAALGELLHDGSWTYLCLSLECVAHPEEEGEVHVWNEKWFRECDGSRRLF